MSPPPTSPTAADAGSPSPRIEPVAHGAGRPRSVAYGAARPRSSGSRALACLAAAGALALSAAGGAHAATMTFGSPLSVPATLDTATGLGYTGYDIPTISGKEAIVVHVNHDAADTALWNVGLATEARGHSPSAPIPVSASSPTAPASGQILSVSLEGCAKPAPGGPPPLTQIHFQDLVPQAGGGVKVNVTTQPFDIPVCGAGGAGGSTVTTYQPTNFCVSEGDYVDFNDEGGFAPGNPQAYPSGVPYQVIGSVQGSTMDSFVANNGVGNGAVFSPGVSSDRNGFAANHNEELMLQATLATGPDATPLCPGGTKGVPSPSQPPPSSGSGSSHGHSPMVTIPKQTDGVNSRGFVKIALYCHASSTCTGKLTIRHGAHSAALGGAPFSVPSLQTGKATVRLSAATQRLVHRLAGKLQVQVTVTVAPGSRQWTEPIGIRGWR